MLSTGNNGHNYNTMFLVPNIKKHQITGAAIEEVSKLIDRLNYSIEEWATVKSKKKPAYISAYVPGKYILDEKIKQPEPETEFITINQLSKVLKWSYAQIRGASYLKIFDGIVFKSHKGRAVKVENVPKFCELIYGFMGE